MIFWRYINHNNREKRRGGNSKILALDSRGSVVSGFGGVQNPAVGKAENQPNTPRTLKSPGMGGCTGTCGTRTEGSKTRSWGDTAPSRPTPRGDHPSLTPAFPQADSGECKAKGLRTPKSPGLGESGNHSEKKGVTWLNTEKSWWLRGPLPRPSPPPTQLSQHKHSDPTLQADDQKYILWGKWPAQEQRAKDHKTRRFPNKQPTYITPGEVQNQ